MKKFLVLVMLLVMCGCGNRVLVVKNGDTINDIKIPNEQTIESIDWNVNPSNSYVIVKWKLEGK